MVCGQKKHEVEAAKFEALEWSLVQEKVKADILAVQVYRSKLTCHDSLIYHAQIEHVRKRRVQAREAVETLFAGVGAMFSYKENLADVMASPSSKLTAICRKSSRCLC